MNRNELLFKVSEKAAKRMSIASELVIQLWAVQSFENQQLVTNDAASEDVIRIVSAFHDEVAEVKSLIAEFLELRAMQEHATIVRDQIYPAAAEEAR